MEWTPTISDRRGPIYQRIVAALADDIAAGRLLQGRRLPTHRALATALGVDLTTVTRAYAEARALDLVEARVGRGTFVKAGAGALRQRASAPDIDLSMNLPPQPPEADLENRMAAAMAAIRGQAGFSAYLTYQQAGGSMAERNVASDWLRARTSGLAAPSERLLIAPGTQPTLLALVLALTSPGDGILTSSLTYPGMKAVATEAHVRLVGVAMDEEGLDPAALEESCRAHKARVIYLTPTMHNPTTATMSPARRAKIAEIIERHALTLIEDDPYVFLAPRVKPIAALIPGRSYFAASLSKAIAPGLRTSLLVVPDREAAARVTGALRATVQMSAPLMTAIAVNWMHDGSADAIIAAIAAEAAARQKLARELLGSHSYAAHPSGHHIWLPVPSDRASFQIASSLQRRSLAVVTGDAFAVTPDAPNGIRVALGAAHNQAQLTRALEILRDALTTHALGEQIV